MCVFVCAVGSRHRGDDEKWSALTPETEGEDEVGLGVGVARG